MTLYEPETVRLWLMAQLVAHDWDTMLPGGWHRGIAPLGTLYPYGSFHVQAFEPDTKNISQRRVITAAQWAVFATGEEGQSDANLATIAGEIDDVLDRASGSAGAGVIYMATRIRPWDRNYAQNGTTFVENGGLYRIWVK